MGGFELKTVSSHDLKTNTWLVNPPPMREARDSAGACLLQGIVYVFAGRVSNYDTTGVQSSVFLNFIEKIATESL